MPANMNGGLDNVTYLWEFYAVTYQKAGASAVSGCYPN